ncbi:MAG: 16S rRNA (cytosine(1402)-N(4))-methyltransferase RsmH [Candidatus Cloacimonetes bacterium]|nr:16S rRNA (cytosine(1402)-N(4))-methyltransferase RsmH [Candidatus Cloacimonadota bacterium]NLO43816.1 16S rRNA (cytosine(1402)-N(4))-methyltransferase RsmH [Candidatus Cloacimonadota bacterium]
MTQYHLPVLANQCAEYLNLRPGGIYVDATVGGGGHSLKFFEIEPKIRLFAFDQDDEALTHAGKVLEKHNPVFIKSNFRHLRTELALRKISNIDGILFDLGVSSHQLDEAERGFSFDKEAALDMRMDRESELSAKQVINEYDARELRRIFKEYGEDNLAGRIAKAIEQERSNKKIESTGELAKIIEQVAGKGSKESLKTKVRIFQALRIYVNDELDALSFALQDAINILAPGGRIVVLSYHSLEDRIVKNIFRTAEQDCLCPPEIIKCICDHKSQLKVLTKKPVLAGEEELEQNIRSRSAKLRAAEKKGEK